MDLHYGQIVEKVIRRKGYSISEVARFTKVNRRSVYNWFNQKNLKTEIIFRIGISLKHDFSVEFPHLFTGKEFENVIKDFKFSDFEPEPAAEQSENSYWKDKYIDLLEKYSEILIKNAEKNQLKSPEQQGNN
ncbi:hypothetical protein [Mucilaginibacter sp. SP1R1]|uniref:hypothetical protein n=1 Tax=Mucilaginibacter sp. SP1R1 TaxID=2723091 RepID=UPI00161FD611|nr:hypothetical protein [Mucilaginibacter sp. SP1R1]MBB6149077.1 transcriptional regulator with XRE-family HTH domain [Mucilaginibacter sp. SP1R1]